MSLNPLKHRSPHRYIHIYVYTLRVPPVTCTEHQLQVKRQLSLLFHLPLLWTNG